jgi:dTDP-4-amino-4,6-dideoxygalactose transaminase
MIPAHAPPHNANELFKATMSTLKNKEMKAAFEEAVKKFLQTDNYVSTASGRRALFLGLKKLGISQGDEVILPAFTSDIVPLVIREAGAVPVPADVGLDSYNLDPQSVLSRISDRTRAILTVHTFGQPSDIRAISDICKDYRLPLIEDAASAFGAMYHNRPVGTFGDVGVVSFGFGKSISMGGGGGLIASNADLLKNINDTAGHKSSLNLFVKVLGSVILSKPHFYGLIGCRVKDGIVSHEYDHYSEEVVDSTDNPLLSYALGILELNSDIIEKRRRIAREYHSIFCKYKGLHVPVESKSTRGTYTRYFVRVEDGSAKKEIFRKMLTHGIEPILPDMGYPVSKSLYPDRWDQGINNSCTLSKTLIGIPVYKAISNAALESVLNDAAIARA